MKPTSMPPISSSQILIITGEELRHQYFVNQLNARFPLAAVLTESFDYPEPKAGSEAEKSAWNWFFQRRKKYEELTFAKKNSLPLNTPASITVGKGQLNSEATLEIINKIHPGLIVLFGTSLLKRRLIQLYQGNLFNLHVGLPGHFRGSSCNFWPIHNRRMEYLGASVHKVDEGIDCGEIVAQGKISLDVEDDEQTLGGKTLILGIQLMASVILNWQQGTLESIPQKNKGKLFLIKEFTPKAVLEVRQMVESGEMKDQIKRINQQRKNLSADLGGD